MDMCPPAGAFVETFTLSPVCAGQLDGLTFAVKDNIDVGGHRTSFGSPSWAKTHPAPIHNALCVDQILAAGATCLGKTVADEFTYSLDGESAFFGTPLNAKAPDRIPGGSSSGSASAVAAGLVDFALGTDSGGSIRVPASLCGVWGMRPSLHRISEAGVIPFMPSVSTVGALAANLDTLDRVMHTLLACGREPTVRANRLILLDDALALADKAVREAAVATVMRIGEKAGLQPERHRLADIVGWNFDLAASNAKALRNLQTLEFVNTVGDWIETAKPELGFVFTQAYGNVKAFDRNAALDSIALCERLFAAINRFLSAGAIVCFPTTPTAAPYKGSLNALPAVLDFYDRTMAITAFSGVGRLPELSAPILTADGCPVGLSMAAGHYQDEFLLEAAKQLLTED